jgi:hypothetical protein
MERKKAVRREAEQPGRMTEGLLRRSAVTPDSSRTGLGWPGVRGDWISGRYSDVHRMDGQIFTALTVRMISDATL